jgi:CO dehydrogenase maturation factor
MRIAFLGKGGAGKTTTSAGFIQYLAKRNPFVMAIDADLNAHLQSALSLKGSVEQLGLHFDEVTTYLRGERSDLGERPMIGTTPPASGSNFITARRDDPFVQKYALFENNIALLTVGTYQQEDVGGSCYHEKLKSLAGIFHHLLDTEEDLIVADTTAGTDNVATSLSFAYDMNVFVLEPTEKSTQVVLDFLQIAGNLGDRTYVIGNKVDGDEDAEYIMGRVGKEKYLGSIPFSRNLKRFEQGEEDALEEFAREQETVFARVQEVWKSHKRDWNDYRERLHKTYKWDCERWYADYYKQDLYTGIDTTFTYADAFAKLNLNPSPVAKNEAEKAPALATR